ncbi:MAG: aminotransferase class I/II-fold pyridoxal phosphate-dependent enzyme [SAR324 cluster bacterium]|nr:aminotransferase class I/II-fold pyridoxal phosphate-dependent enzyme [SAR324 cluster bacterium]
MELQFGKSVQAEGLQLAKSGKDVNQVAQVLCDKDNQGHNYGIGIVLNGNGQPMNTSATLLEYISAELEYSKRGTYMNSAKIMDELKQTVLRWQRIPEQYWNQFRLALPSDAGTGAVKSAVELTLLQNPSFHTLGIQALGWPAYKTIAKLAHLQCQEFAEDSIIAEPNTLPVYQAGPLNTTGRVCQKDIIEARAKTAAETNTPVVLDRAYSGFEFTRLIPSKSYDDIMRMSYELQIQPFIEQGTSFSLAISPTKVFVTFALRPCGLLLVFCPETKPNQELTNSLNMTMRARGSSFEHVTTRAFTKALVQDLPRLEEEHHGALKRLAEAEAGWRKLVEGTPIDYLYSEQYAGLFRNPKANDDAAVHIYNEHIYPVFAQGRCRQNVTGIPDDEQLARKHVAVFAGQCF